MVEIERKFYKIVLAVGAKLAAADGSPDSTELDQLKLFFKINVDYLPEAATIYNGQLHNPTPIGTILSPLRTFLREKPAMAEALLFGMCQVAKADGVVHSNELKTLTELARLTIDHEPTWRRVLIAAGVMDEPNKEERRQGERTNTTTDRRRLLGTLGLLSNASAQEIEEEYRRLVKRYHPDRLRGLGMPEDEIRHAENLLSEINQAYERLKKLH